MTTLEKQIFFSLNQNQNQNQKKIPRFSTHKKESQSLTKSEGSKSGANLGASNAPIHTHSLYNSLFRQDGFSHLCANPTLVFRNIVLPHRTPMERSLVWFKDNSSIIRGYGIALGDGMHAKMQRAEQSISIFQVSVEGQSPARSHILGGG